MKFTKALIINETKMEVNLTLPNGMTTSALIITDYNVKIIPIEQKVFHSLIRETFNIAYEKLEYEILEKETIRLMNIVNGRSDETEYEIIVKHGVGNIQKLLIQFIE